MQTIIEKNLPKLKELCQKYDIKTMYVFGSASSDDFKEDSDIDILINFKEGISIEKYTDNYFELHYKLEELFNRKIDLVTENSLANPYLKDSIDKTKKLLYAA
jgi:predicted nucleotidyltransferase